MRNLGNNTTESVRTISSRTPEEFLMEENRLLQKEVDLLRDKIIELTKHPFDNYDGQFYKHYERMKEAIKYVVDEYSKTSTISRYGMTRLEAVVGIYNQPLDGRI
jgi:hypothetical protein